MSSRFISGYTVGRSGNAASSATICDDILRTGRNDEVTARFVGSIAYLEKGLYHVSSQAPLLVFDGQQRLTTIMLLIEALASALDGEEPLSDFSSKKLRNYYLLNPLEDVESRYKLVLSQTDKASLKALFDQQANSVRTTQFRQWATQVLREFAIKGYLLDKKRMENGAFLSEDYFERLLQEIRDIRLSDKNFYQKINNISSISVDCNRDAPTTKAFFAKVQNNRLRLF